MTLAENNLMTLPKWTTDLKSAALTTLANFPAYTGKEEEWRWTPIQPIFRTSYAPAEVASAGDLFDQNTFGDEASIELVFVNGIFSADQSKLPENVKGLTVSTLSEALNGPLAETIRKNLNHVLKTPNVFALRNTASLTDGVFIHVLRNTTIEKPIHLLFVTVGQDQPVICSPRTLVVAEDNVEVAFVETYAGRGANYLTNAVTEIIAGQDCRIDHCKLNRESIEGNHVASMQVEIGKSTQFVSHSITLGGKLSRNNLGVKLSGEYADATLNGLVLVEGNQHCDNHTILDHASPNCPSHELYKHVLDGKSSCIFKGQIFVNQIAQKTNSKQTSKTLLLSDDAMMNSQPALEIYADDVKCTHGSTTGPIDEEHVFYLRSRGVSLETARHLLTYAFAADITRRIRVEPVRRRVEDFMSNKHGLPQDLRINDLGSHDAKVTM